MNVLHYTLGLPPYRSGGLTKYSLDLMLGQKASGTNVSLIYPGDFTFWRSQRPRIEKQQNQFGLNAFELKNPVPVPLLHGIKEPKAIYKPKHKLSQKEIEQFYKDVQSDIFHIHTLMGLPEKLLSYFKSRGVKIVYTSHDYYGLCPKVNFINEENKICNKPNGEACARCNANAPGALFLRLRNSKYLLKHKARLKGKTSAGSAPKAPEKNLIPDSETSSGCEELLKHDQRLFSYVDRFHFNSELTKTVYENFFSNESSEVIAITHAGILDNRKAKQIAPQKVRIGFIGSISAYKGFPLLKEVLCKLDNEGLSNWELVVWGSIEGTDRDSSKISYKGKYQAESLPHIFDTMDLLVVPSRWKETFSLVTLEAISYGVPVIVSDNVGAKDILNPYESRTRFNPDSLGLAEILRYYLETPKKLEYYNKEINSNEFRHTMKSHLAQINDFYQFKKATS